HPHGRVGEGEPDEAAGGDQDQDRGRHEYSASLGFSFETLRRFSSASFSAFESFFGTVTRTRASRSPLPEPFSRGAPWPLIRSSFPFSEPGAIFRLTR